MIRAMKSPDGATKTIWYEKAELPSFRPPTAQTKMDADVCVVGAGIAGLTTAYLAAKAGRSVAVFDEGPIGSGQTGRTSAHLASEIDDRFIEIERLHGAEGARLAYESHAAAIDTIERISRQEKIECEFKRLDAYLSCVPGDPPDLLDKEFQAAKRAGFADVEIVERGGLDHNRCLRFGNQARFHPLLYLAGLAEAIKRMGGRIFVGKRVIDVQGSDPKTRKPGRVKLQDMRKTFAAQHIVVATNTPAPINDWFGIYTKQSAYRTYMIGAAVPPGSVADALYWDTGDPYHYVRLERSKDEGTDVLLVGGEDHKTGQFPQEGAPFTALETWARLKFPMMREVHYRWSGQVQEPADGLAFIGRAPTDKQEVFVATGDSGMGLTHGTIAGLLINDLIGGKPNPWEQLYDPSRKMMNTEFVTENANVVKQYVDLVTPGQIKSVDEIPAGQGAVMRDGLSKIAVYRDPNGRVHECSAVCTHLQCIVQWNHIEQTWDCPCHGSRFDPLGKVLMGPAIDDLPPIGRENK
jgi:glycine/D-amino acid oxidase-like deaminating enzyme/nitrite reductase/ring-hydroxylating ferredoxin subunit